jgi:hypothetical protein
MPSPSVRSLFHSLLLATLTACSSTSTPSTPTEQPKAPPPIPWRALPADPGESDAHPEAKTATVALPPPSGSAASEGIPLVKGAVPGSADTIAAMQPGFDKCYKDALKKDPKTEGRTRLVVKVGTDAAILSVTPTMVDGLSDSVVACLVGVAQKAEFQRPVGVGTVLIPIDLSKH